MKTLRTTKSEQILFSTLLVSCSVLVLGALVVLLTPHAPSLQLVHAVTTHLSVVTPKAG